MYALLVEVTRRQQHEDIENTLRLLWKKSLYLMNALFSILGDDEVSDHVSTW